MSKKNKDKISLFEIVGIIVFIAYIILVCGGLLIYDSQLLLRGLIGCAIAFLVPVTIAQTVIYFVKRAKYKKGEPIDKYDDHIDLDYFDEKDLEG